ncbi:MULTISPECIES: hypothetical protein [unclassified Thioalkalivibrio]|uniref:hypothetical protein n=1 Tax=unclassified Thioalkalivibrio TaxID=2621013 RepID=UPI0003779E9B|nr:MULTISPECIES: hypothetical protein [unclassified Thioalkalivibrio]
MLHRLRERLTGQDRGAPLGQIVLWEVIAYGAVAAILMGAVYGVTCLFAFLGFMDECVSLFAVMEGFLGWLSRLSGG